MVTEEEKLDIGEAYYEDGYKRGIEIGLKQGKEDVALAMLSKGIDDLVIAECTGLSVEEIKSLRKG